MAVTQVLFFTEVFSHNSLQSKRPGVTDLSLREMGEEVGGGGGGVLTCLCEMPQVIATSVIHDSANIIPYERKEVCFIFGQEMKNDKYNYYDIIKNFCP